MKKYDFTKTYRFTRGPVHPAGMPCIRPRVHAPPPRCSTTPSADVWWLFALGHIFGRLGSEPLEKDMTAAADGVERRRHKRNGYQDRGRTQQRSGARGRREEEREEHACDLVVDGPGPGQRGSGFHEVGDGRAGTPWSSRRGWAELGGWAAACCDVRGTPGTNACRTRGWSWASRRARRSLPRRP